MAPKEKVLLDALRKTTISVYNSDPFSLTVRRVREEVIADLDLDEDFFAEEPWKGKSKALIQGVAAELNDPEDDSNGDAPPTPEKSKPKQKPTIKKVEAAKKVTKRVALAKKAARPTKRAKREVTSSDDEDEDDDLSSEASFGGVSDDAEASAKSSGFGSDSEDARPAKKSRPAAGKKAGALKRKTVASESDDEDSVIEDEKASDSDASSEPPTKKSKTKAETTKPVKKATAISKSASAKKTAQSTEYVSDDGNSSTETRPTAAKKTTKVVTAPEEKAPVSVEKQEDSESEMSVVLDEPPPRKRQKSNPKSTSTATTKSKSKAKPTTTTADLSPDEQHLKTLLSQLKKCGIKKIYQFTLSKEYGDDIKGKIAFLQKELRSVGMTGKFSESRAKEIKEQRELMADLEAVKEGEKAWGVDDGGRRGRKASARRKSLREVESESEDDDEDGEDGSEGGKGKGKWKKDVSDHDVVGHGDDGGSGEESEVPPDRNWAKKDLAFLDNDEDDSD